MLCKNLIFVVNKMQAEITGQPLFKTHFIQIQVCVGCTDLPIFK